MKIYKFIAISCLALSICGVAPGAVTTTTHKTAVKAVPHKGKARRSKTTAASSKERLQRGQSAPTPDRYREIQEALAAKGYLKTPPTGEWDASSQEAMRNFQADQKLDQTGKLNAKSLISLGLGPAKQSEPPSPTGSSGK
jgi:peptidoglycan hydrolase-like protein with peptidoglycan-binding domain